jgi:hypothetical protein
MVLDHAYANSKVITHGDFQEFETLLIELNQVHFVTLVWGYEVKLQKILENQRTCDEDAQERKAIQESAVDYEFYLHLQSRLCSIIQASKSHVDWSRSICSSEKVWSQ